MRAADNREDTWLVLADWLEENGQDMTELRDEILNGLVSSWTWEARVGVGGVCGVRGGGVGGGGGGGGGGVGAGDAWNFTE